MMTFDWGSLSDTEFEGMCKDILRGEGFSNVQRLSGPGSGDMARDVTAEDTITLEVGRTVTFRWLVQCKNYGRSGKTISPGEVEKYATRAETLGYNRLLIITSHDLSSQAKLFASKISEHPKKNVDVDFYTESDIVDRLLKFAEIREKYFGVKLDVNKGGLEIAGSVDRSGQIYVEAIVECEAANERLPVTFLVDTASESTCILSRHIEALGVSPDSLWRIHVMTPSGEMPARILPHVSLRFETTSGESHRVALDTIVVIDDEKLASGPFSLLGMDVLRGFGISLSEGKLYGGS
jgi:hypothetical protein